VDRIEAGDRVQVAAGPQAGKVGQVTGVIRAKGAADSSAVFKVRFPDGGEAGHVGVNLKKVSS
jgi:ribosomal protein L24